MGGGEKQSRGGRRVVHIEKRVRTCVEPSPRVVEIACMFGLGVDEAREAVMVPPVDLTLRAGEITFITGASGSGKSTILRLIAEALVSASETDGGADQDEALWLVPALEQPPTTGDCVREADRSLIDLINAESSHDIDDDGDGNGDPHTDGIAPAMRLLSLAGLADAFVMLRKVSELSDGQRYRFALARVMEQAEKRKRRRRQSDHSSGQAGLTVILADEFCATLDRFTAGTIARHVRKWVTGMRDCGVCFVGATTHDDLLEALEPDVLIEKHLDGGVEVLRRGSA